MTNFISYKTYEDYIAQGSDRAKAVGAFAQREAEALQAHSELKAEYEKLITESVASGKDATKELDALDGKIADAERVYIRRQREYIAARSVVPVGLSSVDVINGQQGYAKEISKTFVDPYIVKMQKAADLIIEASKEYREAQDEYSSYFGDIKEVHKAAHSSGQTNAFMSPIYPFDKTSVQREIYKLVDRLNAEGVK